MSELLRGELQIKPVWFEVQGNSCGFAVHHTLCGCRRTPRCPRPLAVELGLNPLTADSPARFSAHFASVNMRALPGDHWLYIPGLRSRTTSPAANTSHRSIQDLSALVCVGCSLGARIHASRLRIRVSQPSAGFHLSLGFVGRCRADDCLHGWLFVLVTPSEHLTFLHLYLLCFDSADCRIPAQYSTPASKSTSIASSGTGNGTVPISMSGCVRIRDTGGGIAQALC